MKRRILVVEDTEDNRRILNDLLTAAGYEIIEATDGATGVAMAIDQLPDLILMDMRLPEIDGVSATRMLKADAATQRIPVIALTAHIMDRDRDAALAAGCDDFDTKPVEMERLLAKIEKLLEGR